MQQLFDSLNVSSDSIYVKTKYGSDIYDLCY